MKILTGSGQENRLQSDTRLGCEHYRLDAIVWTEPA